MAPKLRRPAAVVRVPAGRRMRPAAAISKGLGKGPEKRLSQLSLEELRSLGTVHLKKAGYYGREIEICGLAQGVRMAGSELMMDMKVSGTKDDGLLRAVTAQEGRLLEVHICGDGCADVLTGELLVHGRDFDKVNREDEDWYTNMEAVVPRGGEPDELRELREAARAEEAREGTGGPPKPEKEKEARKEKRKEKDKPKEEASKKKKRKEGSGDSQEEEERGRKDLGAIFSGTGLDPDPKKRAKMLRRARKLGKKKKKKKKESDSSTGSSSGSSASKSSSGEEALFSTSKKVKKIWGRYPGALTAGSVKEAKDRLLTSSGTLWSEDRKSLPPLFVHYARTNLLGSGVSPPMAQEILTISMTLDMVLQGKIAAGADILSQRLKALETLTKGSHWSVARQHELCRLDQGGIAEENESLEAARLAREEEKLRTMVSRGGTGGKGQEGTKGKKGKEKSSGKGKGEDASRGKGSEGKKEDQPWQKKK